jgi:hypothetical protein
MSTQRLLSTSESAGFFLRHPIVAEQVAKTRLALAAGVYDWTQTLPQWFFEMIPPWGTQVDDSSYGQVTVYFGTDGTLYLSGWTPDNADINKPAYVPPPVKCKDGSDPILGICPSDFDLTPILIGLGIVAALYFIPRGKS